jgi:hypothetical protein
MLEIGSVVAPSGKLLIVDPGYLRLWYGTQTPSIPEGILSPDATAAARSSVDLKLVGPDAERVGRALDLQWDPNFLFDMPGPFVQTQVDRVREKARELGAQAGVEVLPRRVSHRERIDLALDRGDQAGEITFNGIWAAVVGNVPTGQLRLTAELMPEEHVEAGRLGCVTMELREGPAVRTERFGYTMVD